MSKAIQEMFSNIAPSYDVANDVLSLGTHRYWRTQSLAYAHFKPGADILDICCGTGDMAAAAARSVGPKGKIVALDFVYPMVRRADIKYCSGKASLAQKKRAPIFFLQGDALELPFSDSLFDGVSISFGIRNVDDPVRGLGEMRRVLRKGGKLLVLEFGQPEVPGLREMYHLYSSRIMPFLGNLITGDRAAYEYLPRTAASFPAGRNFIRLMEQAGFCNIRARSFFGGIAFAYVGEETGFDFSTSETTCESRELL